MSAASAIGTMGEGTGKTRLSERELQIARAYASGEGYRAIADELFIAPSTVRTHLSTIYRKLGVSSKVELLRAISGIDLGKRPERDIGASEQQASIAVLPFTNMNCDADLEYFGDGIAEDLITDLSKLPNLAVIARNSTFTFKGRTVDVTDIGRQLGARFVVEGSVRRAGDRIRITSQLIEAASAHHLWAERYDRKLRDIFDVQDEVTREILSALQLRLTVQQSKRVMARGTRHVAAFELLLRGRELYYAFVPQTNTEAAELFRRAISIDPDYAEACAQLGRTYLTRWNLGWSRSVEDSLDPALEWSRRAIALDPELSQAHALISHVYVWRREHEEAIAEADKAVVLEVNHADAHAFRAAALCWAGRAQEALPSIDRAMALNPIYPGWYLFFYGMAAFEGRQYAEAIERFRRGTLRNPEFLPNHFFLAAALAAAGRYDEARIEAATVMSMNAALSVRQLGTFLPYKAAGDFEHFADAARRADLPA